MKDNQQNFEELKRILKLKRHEIPPPGYFSRFSDQVIDRIHAGEAGGSQGFAEKLESSAPWLLNFMRAFDTRPGMVGAFATSLCLLLVLGVIFAEYSEKKQAVQPTLAVSGSTSSPVGTENLAALTTPGSPSPISSGGIVASTNPVTSLAPVATLFGETAGNPLFQSAGFAPAR